MFRRRNDVSDPIVIRLDGKRLTARAGEPVAAALLGAGKTTIARSTKLHRPRGPYCLRGDCDGCLARVDGVPNIMTCMIPATPEMKIETQNTLGSRKTDLLRVTDWFFPKGIDHHHLLAGVVGLSSVMTGFARQLAGVGQLPDQSAPIPEAEERTTDLLVIGGGPAGITVASTVASHGFATILCDDGHRIGGSARAAPRVLSKVLSDNPLHEAEVLTETSACACFVEDGAIIAILASPKGAMRVRPNVVCFANGAHDATLPVPNGDLPGVLSARAMCQLDAMGIVPDGPVAIVGEGRWASTLTKRYAKLEHRRFKSTQVRRIVGRSRVSGIEWSDQAPKSKATTGELFACSVVAVSGPSAPAFELAAQAGATVELGQGGYAVVVDPNGWAGQQRFACGECLGGAQPLRQVLESARHTGRAIEKFLSASSA